MKYILVTALFLCHVAAFAQDLIITGQSGPMAYDRYAEFDPAVTVKNNGIVGINTTFHVAWYLSSDDQLQSSDFFIHFGSSGASLAPGESVEITPDDASIIAGPAHYYLIAKVDFGNTVTETDETNNTLVIPDLVVNPTNVDFTFNYFTIPGTTYAQNSLLMPDYQLKNIGSTDAGGYVGVRFKLSTDAVLDGSDIDLNDPESDPWFHNLFGPDEFYSANYLALLVPRVTPGNYYLLAVADSDGGGWLSQRFTETDESNNVSAQPIQIVESDVDIEITEIINTQYNQQLGRVSGVVMLRNNGTTGVTGYNISAQLVKEGGAPSAYFPVNPNDMVDLPNKYIAPGQLIGLFFDVSIGSIPEPGTYYAVVGVNKIDFSQILENNLQNNIFIDHSRPIYVETQPKPHVKLNSIVVQGQIDEADQVIPVEVTMTNAGHITNFEQRYSISIFNAQNALVHFHTALENVDFEPGETVARHISLTPFQPLPAGIYRIELACIDPCDTDAEPVVANFTIAPTQYVVSGLVRGEDGTTIKKGKLFLYRKESNGQIRFTQKADPYTGPMFSFDVDTDPYTLYFVPDPVQYPDYVPTVYGKTVTLEESSFFTPTGDTDVIMRVLKLQPLAAGDGVISGRLSPDENPLGRAPGEVGNVPVVLLSSTGQIVRFTYADETGYFEFKNLPRDDYQVQAAFEPDAPVQMTEPYAVDITTQNAQVDLVLTDAGIEPEASPLFLPQVLTFSEFSTHRYGDSSLPLDAQSNAGLPIAYTSSDEGVAAIVDNTVVIRGVGEATISASQAGNAYYLPAATTRKLTIHKGLQSISFAALSHQFSDAGSFVLEASASSGLPVSFESSDAGIVSIAGEVATIHKDGLVTITARQAGNSTYESADLAREQLVQLVLATEAGVEGKRLYPNPTEGVVFITMPGVRQVEVSDVTGRVQSQIAWQGQTLDLSQSPAGIYTVKITLQNRTMVSKVVKR